MVPTYLALATFFGVAAMSGQVQSIGQTTPSGLSLGTRCMGQ